MNNGIVILNSNVSLEYVDTLLISGQNYFRYVTDIGDKERNVYSNHQLSSNYKKKNEVANYIFQKANEGLIDIYLNLEDEKTDDNISSDAYQGNNNTDNTINFSDNWHDYMDKALSTILNGSKCNVDAIDLFFAGKSGFSGKYSEIDDSLFATKNSYNKTLQTGSSSPTNLSGLLQNYQVTFWTQSEMIYKMYHDANLEEIEEGNIPGMTDAAKEFYGTEACAAEEKKVWNEFGDKIKNRDSSFSFTELFKELGAVQAKYYLPSFDENKSICLAISKGTSGDEEFEASKVNFIGLTAETLRLTYEEAEKFIMENPNGAAKGLYDIQLGHAENIRDGKSDSDDVKMAEKYANLTDKLYSTDEGKNILWDRFINAGLDEEDSQYPKNITPYDEENAIANTNYITYCMQLNKLNWLVDSCKGFPTVINAINGNEVFSNTKLVDDPDIIASIKLNIDNYGVAPFGYTSKEVEIEKKDGTKEKVTQYYQIEYTERGQGMLYYMDYHCGENAGNSGENRVITAFSNQGRIDSTERNYKGFWINSHIGDNVDKSSKEYESAERDYNILNGLVEDETRYNELTENGEMSFQQFLKFSKLVDDIGILSDTDFKNYSKEDIIKRVEEYEESEKAKLYDFSIKGNLGYSAAEVATSLLMLTASPITAGAILAPEALISLVELGAGIAKFGENVIDASNTALHSDFVLNLETTETGDLYINPELFESYSEFIKLRDNCWDNYVDTDLYKKEYEKFKLTTKADKALEKYIQDNFNTSEEWNNITVSSLSEKYKEGIYKKAFQDYKFKEWDLNDSSSSNYYLATFKLGIRNGGNFSEFENLSKNVKENAIEQFNTEDSVKKDHVGDFMNNKVYENDLYKSIESLSFIKHDNILGMTVNQIGNMAIPVALSAIPGIGPAVGQTLSSGALFTSAFGGAVEEAFNSGASYNEALGYATLSAATELAIEKLFSGIGGYGEGWMDNLIEYVPNKLLDATHLNQNMTAQTLKTLICGGLGEAVEEVTTDFVTPFWQSMTYMSDKTYYDVLNENVSLESLAQTALVSFLSSMIFKGVEINKQTSAFNKNLTNLQNEISNVTDMNLDQAELQTQAKKVLAEYIGGVIENQAVTKSGLLEQLIKNASNDLLNNNPKYAEALSKLQNQLISFNNQEISVGDSKNNITITGGELLKLQDLTGFDCKYTIEDGKIKFENEETQSNFNNKVFEMAQSQVQSSNTKLKEIIESIESSKNKANTNELETAIGVLYEYGNYKNINSSEIVSFRYGDSMIQIPKALAEKITTKLTIENGIITFKKDMTGTKFVDTLYNKAIKLCNDQINKNSYDINKALKNNIVNKAIEIVKPSLETQISNVVVNNIIADTESNLTRIDVQTNISGELRNVSLYVDGNTASSVYVHTDKLTETIQKAIVSNVNSNNIYLGELVYDNKTKTISSKQNTSNGLYVQSLEFENAKKNSSMSSLQDAVNTIIKNGMDLTNSKFVTITYGETSILIPDSLLKEITNKYKIVDGNVKFTQDMKIDKFMSEVYDMAIDISKQNIEGIKNTNIKSSTYVDKDGMYMYKLGVETNIDGKNKMFNIYLDGNTDITSLKDSNKISEKLYELILQNKNAENIYGGNITYNEKTGVMNVTYNEKNKLYVDSINTMVEASEHNGAAVKEETNPGKEIKKGEAYEFTIEEVTEGKSNVKSNENTKTVEKENNRKANLESIATNTAQAASIGVAAGTTSQVVYQNNNGVATSNENSQVGKKEERKDVHRKQGNVQNEAEITHTVNIYEVKSEINSYIDSIKTECERYIELHHNDESFAENFEQLKQEKLVEFNEKLSEIRKAIDDSHISELNSINEKINSLSENDSLRNELILQRDKLIEKQQQEVTDIETTAKEKLQKVFSDMVVENSVNEHLENMGKSQSLTIEIEGKDVDVETLKGLQEPSNLENALKTGEYAGVRVEKALVELSKLDGVTLDSRLQELLRISETLSENEVILNTESIYLENAEPLILNKDFVNTLTIEQKEFLTGISTEQGLIDYLQNNSLTNVEILKSSDLANSNNKYVNKLIELISENDVTTKQVYNAMDVVKNNSAPILVKSMYKGDTHTLSVNEVLDFMKTGKVDTKYSYSDYVKATSSLMNDLASQKSSISIDENVFNGIIKYNNIIDYITGNKDFATLNNVKIIEDCTTFYEFLTSNNITLQEDIMQKLEFISKLEVNKTIANLSDYLQGNNPIVVDKFVRAFGKQIPTLNLIDILKMESKNYLILLRDGQLKGKRTFSRFEIERAINSLISSNSDFGKYYKSNYEKLKNIYESNYVLKNSYIMVPNTFENYSTSFVDKIIHKPFELNSYTINEKQDIISAVNKFANYLDVNGLGSYYSNSMLESINKKVPKIDSSIAIETELYKMFDYFGKAFGADQGAVRKLLTRLKMDDAVQFLCGNKIETKGFMDTLKNMNFTEEQFKNALLEVNKGNKFFLTDENTFDSLKEQVMKNYPGMSEKDATQFLYLMEASEESVGICNYASTVNLIFNKYKNNPRLFEEHFGYPMYVTVDGKNELNTTMLLVDMYSIINKGTLVTVENGNYSVNLNNKGYLNLSDNGKIVMDYFQKFLDRKGIKFDINETYSYQSLYSKDMMYYEEVITNIHNCLARGEHINLSAAGFNLYKTDGTMYGRDISGHIMTVVGITSDGNLIVDSWGEKLLFNLKEQMSNLDDAVKDGNNWYKRRVGIVSYKISLDSAASTVKNTNLGVNEHNGTNVQTFVDTINSQNSSVVSAQEVDASLEFMNSNVELESFSKNSSVDVETLKGLQEPSNLENALKTGEYAGVRVEKALVELSKLDDVNLDSRLQELVRISETLSENEVILNTESVYLENAEPLILNKDFVSTLTVEQKEFLTGISTEQGLIDYLQNNSLTNVEILKSSELANSNNKYVNKLIELISENEGTTKQVYNVMDVVKNNSTPILVESTYKGNVHTLSTNEVLDFMKTGKVDTKYSYSDYVNATNTLMNDLASQKSTIEISEKSFNIVNKYNDLMSGNRVVINIDEVMANPDITLITLPRTINGIDSNIVYRYLTDSEMLNNLLNGSVTDVNVPQLVSALKTLTMMSDSLGLEISFSTKMNIESLYMNNMEDSYVQVVESGLSNFYFEFKEILRNCNGSYQLAISEFERMGHDINEVVISLLSYASCNAYNYEYSKGIYNYSYDYLISKGYTQIDAAYRVASIYEKLLNVRGYDTLIENDIIKIHVQKGLYWHNQPYNLDYIQKELESIKKMYKTNIPVDIYVYDTFNPYEKYWEIKYKIANFQSSATGGNGVINIYMNKNVESTVLSHEYGHLLDTQIMKDNNSFGRISESQEYLDAIAKDDGAPTDYAKINSIEDFAESVAHMWQNPIEFKNKFPNRYEFLSKYISVEVSVDTTNNTNLVTETIDQDSNVDLQINTVFENMVYKFGIQESFDKLCEYVRTGNIDVFSGMDDVIKTISSVDKNVIIKYLNENFGEEIVNEHIGLVDEGIDTRDTEAFIASNQDMPGDVDSDLVSTVNIDGKEIEVETLKQLQTQSNLENALKTGEYSGVRIEKALVELPKLDGVTLDNKLQELVKISETLRQDEIIFNIEDVYSNGGTPNIINIDVYNEFIRSNPNSSISLDDLYGIINSNSDIYKLISNDTIIKNVSNESIKESLSYLVSISNRYNYENKVIRETQYLLDLMNDNYTTEELYDAFAIAHTEFNTPDVYYDCSNYLKTMDVDSAVKLLESKGYTTLDITDAFLNLAIRMDSQEFSKKYYYKAFDYLVENGIDEKEAATIIRDKYGTLINRRGTRVVTTTPNGVKIKIVNNISTNNKLFTVEKIESMIRQAEKYYSKTGLKEIVIFDSFAPHNIYSEKVQYEDYVKTHNNRRFVAAASATNSSIILWEDFDRLDSIVHEYGHTIDKHIKLVNKLATDFSASSTWLDAIQKDTSITSKRVSEYAYASNGEDFAEFIKFFNRNPLEVARKYPNRYKAASKYLNLDIDSNIIERYLDSKKFFIVGIEDLSNLLTEDGSMLEFIKQYVFEDLKGDNSIAKTVISELDAVYESRLDIIEDYGVYSLFMGVREQERIGSHDFIKIMKDYLDGKDISSKFKDSRNLEIIKLLENEQIQEWYEEELNDMTAETEKIPVSDEDFEKMMNSLFNDSESNSSSDTSVIEENEIMDFPIHDVPTTQNLEPYKVVSKYHHDDLIISEELVEKFSQRTIDAFISIYEYIPNLGQYIGKMDISGKTKLLDIINSLNVDIDSNSTLKQLKNLIEQLDGRHVFNLEDLSNDSKLVMLPKELYTQYGEQIDYLHNICSREYSLKRFLENPDLKILSELKNGLFKDTNFDPNTYYLIQRLYDASNVLLDDKVIVNIQNFASKKGTELIVVDKETFGLYKEELKQFDYITEDVYNLKNFILKSSDSDILKLKNLFDEVNLETSDEFINKVKNIIYELSNGKTIVNIREYNWIENPIIMSKDIYNLNKEIVDNVVESIEYNSTLIKYLDSVDINTATKLKQLIDNGDLVINTDNGKMLNKLINDIASGNKIVNLNDVVYRGEKPLVISGEVYNDYVNLSSNSDIAIDVIYDLFDSKDLIYRLLSNNAIFNNVSNENIINSLKLYLSIAENKGYSDSVINKIKFYLDVMSDTPQFIPSEFNGYKVRTLEIILNNPTKINGYTTLEKENILKALNEYSKFIKNNYPSHYMSYSENIKALTRNVPKVDSNIAIETELCKMFDNIGKIFGADQGAVRELIKRLKMNDAVQFLFGNKIETNDFMDTLNNMHFTEEQFENALLEVNKESKSFLTDKNTFDSLKKLVIKNYPGMSEKDAEQFLYLVETIEGGAVGICNYASTVNLIFDKYKNNPKLFEEHFGYPMYVTIDGKNELNTTMLLVDMYSIINDGVLVTKEDGVYKVKTSNKKYLNLSDNGKLVMEYFQKFLDRKGIKFNIKEKFAYNSLNTNNMMHYEEVITNIHNAFARGEHIHIASAGFNLYKTDGTISSKNVGGHIMSVVGITADGNLIVDSWGEKLIFNLKEQMSNLGDVYEIEEKFGIERTKRVSIVSYDISLDNSSNTSTNSNKGENINNSTNTQTFGESINSPKSSVTSTIDTDLDINTDGNTEGNIHNGAYTEVFDVPSDLTKSNITSSVITDEDLIFIDEGSNTRGVGAFKASGQDIPTTQDSELYKVISKNNYEDLTITNDLVKKFGYEIVDDFIYLYENDSDYNFIKVIENMDMDSIRKVLGIINELGIDIDSNATLSKIKQLFEPLDGRHVFNLSEYISHFEKPIMLPKELYTQYGEQIDYLHNICSREYYLKAFLENPDLKILKELKDGLFKDTNFDPNTYYLIQRLYDASNVLLEDKVIVNTKNFVSKKCTELIVVDKETFELYKEELKQFDYITEDVYNLRNFILNSSDVEILKLKNLFDEVNLETSDEFINKVKNIIYELSNGKTIVNIREYNWIENPIIMPKYIYNLNKEIVDNVVENIEYNSTLIKYLESVDINTATKLKQLIDNEELVINTKNGEILNKLINDIASGNKIVNLNDVVRHDAKPFVISGEVYNSYVNLSSNSDIAIDVIYDIFDSKDLIFRLLSNNTILSDASNEKVINSLKLYLAIAENKGYSDAVVNEIKYYLDVMSDTPQFIPSEFNGHKVRTLEILLNNPTKINGFTLLQKENILKAVNEYTEFIKNNYPEHYMSYADNIKALTRNMPKIDSNIAIETELYRMFENIGKIFGADQGAVRELLTRLKMNDVVQFLCGNKIEENNFMDTLNNMHFTEEQFKNKLLEVNKESKSFLTDKSTFDSLKEQVMKNYPGMSEKDATQFLYLMEAYKDSEGICNYAAAVNLIFNKYKNNPKLFEEHFGYPMYVTIEGKNELNTTMLLVDMYSIINDGRLVTNENGVYKVNTSNEKYLNLSDNGKLNMEYFQKFLDAKKITKFNIKETYAYHSELWAIPNSTDMMHYEEVIKNIHDCLARGEHVDISAIGFNLYKPDGTIIAKNVGGHIMTVVGITSDGNLIVDSWGEKLIFNLKEQMSNLGDVYKVTAFGTELRKNVDIVSYNISLDNSSNTLTNSNKGENINNGTNTQTFGESINSPKSSVTSTIDADSNFIDVSDEIKHKQSIIEDADVDMAFTTKSIFSKKIETVSVSDIPRVFRNMNTTDIISILEGKTTLMNDENFINNKKSIIRFIKYLSENNIKLSLNERANTIIENLRNGDFRLNILNFSDVLNGDSPIYGPSSISFDGIKISTDDVMSYLENKKNEISSIITSDTPNEDARDLLNAIDELASKNDIIYDKYRKSIKLIERIERSYVYKSYDSYYLLPKSFNGIDTSNILNSDILSLTSYINSLSNADKKSYRVALDEFGKYIYKSNTRLSKQDLSRVNKLYDVINTKKFSTDAVIKSKVYDTFEMSYQNDGEFGSNQGKVREVIEKLGITDVIQSLFSERVERSKFLQTLSEFNISERDFITALNKRTQRGIMNDLYKDGDINLELYGSLIRQVKINYPTMSTMDAVRFLYLIETKEAGGPGICNNPILVNMIFDRYVGKEIQFERDFGYPMYIMANNGKKVLNEARLLVDIFSTLNDGVLVHNVNGKYMIQTTSVNYVRAYDLNGLRLDAIEKFINKKGININVSKSYFFNSNEELMHYDYLVEQIKSELSKGNYVIFGGKGFDMDVENFEFRKDCDAHGMTIVGIDTTGELILDSWGMKARVDLKKELSRLNTKFKDRNSNMIERIFTISSYNIS